MDIVNIIGKELKRIAPEAEIILYGSEARGESRQDSDIDLLVVLPEYNDVQEYITTRSMISGHLFELSLELGIDISPLVLPRNIWDSRKTPFKVNVINDGIRIGKSSVAAGLIPATSARTISHAQYCVAYTTRKVYTSKERKGTIPELLRFGN